MPQGLCTGCSSAWNALPPGSCMAPSFISRSLYSNVPIAVAPSLPSLCKFASPVPSPICLTLLFCFIFLLSICHLMYCVFYAFTYFIVLSHTHYNRDLTATRGSNFKPPPVFVNKDSSEHSHIHSSAYCLWPLSRYSGSVAATRWLQSPSGP